MRPNFYDNIVFGIGKLLAELNIRNDKTKFTFQF